MLPWRTVQPLKAWAEVTESIVLFPTHSLGHRPAHGKQVNLQRERHGTQIRGSRPDCLTNYWSLGWAENIIDTDQYRRERTLYAFNQKGIIVLDTFQNNEAAKFISQLMSQSFLTHQAVSQDTWRRHSNIAERRLRWKQTTNLFTREEKKKCFCAQISEVE